MNMNENIKEIVFNLQEKYYGFGADVSSSELDLKIEKVLQQLGSDDERIFFIQELASRKMYHTSGVKFAEKLFSRLEFDEFGKNLMRKLKAIESDICLYLNPKLLNERFKPFENYIIIFATDSTGVQENLLSLSDAKLKFLEDITNVLEQSGAHKGEIIAQILDNIGLSHMMHKEEYQLLNKEIEKLYANGQHLSGKQIEKIMYLYVTNSKEDVKTVGELETLDEKRKERLIDIINTSNNIEIVREEILKYSYGLSCREAMDIIAKYKIEPEKCTAEEYRKKLIQYDAIRGIVESSDLGELKEVGENISKMDIKAAYLRRIVLHSEFRNMFLHEYNNSLYQVKAEDRLRDTNTSVETYKVNGNFNMIVTCIGAYQGDFKNQENYASYWNQPHIKHITNPCSFIGNDNLTTAKIKNVVFGFTDFNNNMLFNAMNMDRNSSTVRQSPRYTNVNGPSFFAFSQTLKNSTRSQYNELMFERRNSYDIDGVNKKKQPSYIVFFEEFKNEQIYNVTSEEIGKMDSERKAIILEQKRMWEESKKAAKDFNIPLVIVNREECAMRENAKRQKLLEEIKAGRKEKVVELITIFENGRISYGESHKYIRDKYFSKEELDSILESLLSYKDTKINKYIFDTIKEEEKKWKKGKSRCLDGQTSAIDFDKYRNIETGLKGSIDIGE